MRRRGEEKNQTAEGQSAQGRGSTEVIHDNTNKRVTFFFLPLLSGVKDMPPGRRSRKVE